jgi:hypothetical protein
MGVTNMVRYALVVAIVLTGAVAHAQVKNSGVSDKDLSIPSGYKEVREADRDERGGQRKR